MFEVPLVTTKKYIVPVSFNKKENGEKVFQSGVLIEAGTPCQLHSPNPDDSLNVNGVFNFTTYDGGAVTKTTKSEGTAYGIPVAGIQPRIHTNE